VRMRVFVIVSCTSYRIIDIIILLMNLRWRLLDLIFAPALLYIDLSLSRLWR